ncbi:MAG TPA: GNAT family N-acetyltransferase [Kofleriaceae bacterium]|jgi:aminoglycoside 6'-N-acetyltransferase I|nr:GNAT family N-acetyltransferase [Kofleriaceae bacterium]
MRDDEVAAVHEMMRALWPDFDGDAGPGEILVWERPDGAGLGGFVQLNVRAYGEGCDTQPVPWIEGWWVAPDLRRSGVGRALVAEVERWAREGGFTELGSDTWLDNTGSIAAHEALGFEKTEQLQFFRKKLR